MKKRTYYILGYGICVNDIKDVSTEKLAELIHSAPQFERNLYLELLEAKYKGKPDHIYRLKLAEILQMVIAENGVELTIAEDDDTGKTFLLLPPSYPWERNNIKISTEELTAILDRFTAIISDEKIAVQFFDYGSTS